MSVEKLALAIFELECSENYDEYEAYSNLYGSDASWVSEELAAHLCANPRTYIDESWDSNDTGLAAWVFKSGIAPVEFVEAALRFDFSFLNLDFFSWEFVNEALSIMESVLHHDLATDDSVSVLLDGVVSLRVFGRNDDLSFAEFLAENKLYVPLHFFVSLMQLFPDLYADFKVECANTLAKIDTFVRAESMKAPKVPKNDLSFPQALALVDDPILFLGLMKAGVSGESLQDLVSISNSV